MTCKPMALALALFCLAAPAPAQDLASSQDFTFKRIKVPAPGSRPKITVQIDPEEQARWLDARADDAPSDTAGLASAPMPLDPGSARVAGDGRAVGELSWFWSSVPVSGLGAGGLDTALAALSRPSGGHAAPSFRLDDLGRIADRHGAAILRESVGTQVSPALALAVIAVESAGRPGAVSHAGAQGLMQLMPATAERFGVSDALDPRQNIRGGVRYLDWLLGHFGGDAVLALAGYNAGEGAVRRHAGVPPYAETRDYVPKVLAAFAVARGLCATPPMLVSDGCVFVGERMAGNG